jgi:hypothetical protein
MDGMRMDIKEFSDKFCEQDHRTFFPFLFLSLQSLRTDGVIHGRFQRDVIFFLGICLQKAAALNRQYQSIFTEEPPGDIPTKEDGLITPMANILFTKEGVEKLL